MDYNSKNVQANDGIDFQIIAQYAVRLAQKWWAILLSALICASVGFIVAKVTYVPKYTCTMEFVVSNKEDLKKAKQIIDEERLTEKCNVYISPVFGRIEPVTIVDFMIENKMNKVNMQLQMHKIIWDPEKKGV